ncbi:MAG: asparagine synthase-related protein [Bacillota bacterium]|jgi:uncharacterized protein
MRFTEKKERLNEIVAASENPVVAYSGGVDSSLVTALVRARHGDAAQIYSVITPYMDEADIYFAAAAAKKNGWPVQWIRLNPLGAAEIARNSEDRCYHCKKRLFSAIKGKGEEQNGKTFLEGSNSDDTAVFRPGRRALAEMGFVSPLAEAGLTKAEIRRFAAELGLDAAERPSKPCLLTRFPYDLPTPVTEAMIERVKEGEHQLKAYLNDNFRLRWVSETEARLEVSDLDRDILTLGGKTILDKIPFAAVTVDSEPFQSGSFDRKKKERS